MKNEFFLLVFLLVLVTVFAFMNQAFLTTHNFFDLIKNGSGIFILALGFFVVLLSGGIDLSFSAIGIFCSYFATQILIANNIDSVLLAFLLACLIGIFLGAINGFLISVFKIPTLITTLATFSMFNGVLLVLAGGRSFYAGEIPKSYNEFGQITLFRISTSGGGSIGLSIFILIAIGVLLITWFLLKFTLLGKGIYAIGGNMESAKRSGFSITKIQFFVYCYMGFLAGLVSIMDAVRLRSVVTSGISYPDLMVVAAVILGGASILGGGGTILGTFLGVAILTILNGNLVLVGLSSLWTQLVIGLVIIAGISITSVQSKFTQKGISIYNTE